MEKLLKYKKNSQRIRIFLVVDEVKLQLGVELAGIAVNVTFANRSLDPVREEPFPDLKIFYKL